MIWTKELFGVEKPVIALLHFNPFPGDPRFVDGVDSMEKTVADARADLKALQDSGVDGILFSNEFSFPYPVKADPVIGCGMARVIGELKNELRLPFGIDLEADPMAAVDLAAAVGADFMRGTFNGTYVGVLGVTAPDVAAVLRRKRALGLNKLRMLYFLNNEADSYLVPIDYAELASSIVFNCKPDGFCVAGAHAGLEASSDLIERTRERVRSDGVPVFAATGCTADNIREKLAVSDGVLVGTTLKEGGEFERHIDPKRVRDFMSRVKEYRAAQA